MVKKIKKVAMLGVPQVGKTELIRRYVFDQFDDSYIRTLGVKVTKADKVPYRYHHNKNPSDVMDMMIWDTHGDLIIKHENMDLYRNYLLGSSGLIITYDSTNKKSFDNLTKSLRFARATLGQMPAVFIGNKIDKEHSEEFERMLSEKASGWDADYFITSAKTGDKVTSAFRNLARAMANEASY